MNRLVWIVAAALPFSASAFEIGESEYVFLSDLAKRGYVPFAVSSKIGASFGMTDGDDPYLCFSLDQPTAQAKRREILIAEVAGQAPDRTVPNIPIVCVLTQ